MDSIIANASLTSVTAWSDSPRGRRAGDYFAESAMLVGMARRATVVAETEMVINVLNPRESSSLLQQNPTIAKKIYVQAIRRLYEDNSRGLQESIVNSRPVRSSSAAAPMSISDTCAQQVGERGFVAGVDDGAEQCRETFAPQLRAGVVDRDLEETVREEQQTVICREFGLVAFVAGAE